ncbi:MAG: hypothetical protein B7Z40_11105 [Bosea sp. 12-68-7]|nr:MAG: hypothetical protein B7Z40_11105 [Bosea sp. 12-68-7]
MLERNLARPLALTLLLGLGVAACAPQQSTSGAASPSAPAASMQGHNMSGMQGHNMSGMQGHNMSGMDHQAMMAHCAQMRQQAQPGASAPAGMQQMMAQCSQMERSMGSSPTR